MSSGMTAAVVLAHTGGGSGGELVMTIMFVTVLAIIWTALGVLCWVFWRAKKREDAAKLERDLEEWPSELSS